MENLPRRKFCTGCGSRLDNALALPNNGLLCSQCGRQTFKTPDPVVVLIIPSGVGTSVLTVRRTEEPYKSQFELPNWPMVRGEKWQKTGMRRAHEDHGIIASGHDFGYPTHLTTDTSSDGKRLLVFATMNAFCIDEENLERKYSEYADRFEDDKTKFSSPQHQKALGLYWAKVKAERKELDEHFARR